MYGGYVRKRVGNERGMALVIALLLMLVGTIIGIFGVNTGVIETRIAGNERLSNLAFYMADGGTDLGPVIINDVITNYSIPSYGGEMTIDPNLMPEILGGADNDPDTAASSPDIQNDLGN
ncbi:MAG: PilX N-terminal domain-containing pilus assembly protein, partial [Thermodesulfobacteriota bacterium]